MFISVYFAVKAKLLQTMLPAPSSSCTSPKVSALSDKIFSPKTQVPANPRAGGWMGTPELVQLPSATTVGKLVHVKPQITHRIAHTTGLTRGTSKGIEGGTSGCSACPRVQQ